MKRIVYFELHSPAIEKTMKFFEDVFDWKINPSGIGEEEYWLATTGDEKDAGINGGLMKARDGQPRTVNTIEVESVDDYAKKVKDAGGQIVVEKFPIPSVGYVAYAVDPAGVLFGIYHTNDCNGWASA